jgi:serine/threonine-protein kinase
MAELYLALQKSVAGFEKLIVVKRILPHLATDRTFVEMLLGEARIAATLTHPNIAQVYDVGVAEDDYFIAMEHVHGEDLRSIVRQMRQKEVRSFPLEHTLAIVMGCCKGLAYAHDRRDLDGEPLEIVHRDISPQNILVTFTGDVKIVDFGIAKARSSTDDEEGQLKGKVPYMSPEQAQGLPLDARSDIFSLGVMLFELCTGKRLFKGSDERETLQRIVQGHYPRPTQVNPHLSPRLEAIIERALMVDPDMRYPDAREMQADLESYIREERLAVSALSLGEWMQMLFDEKLAQQKQMLQEGRQLAEVLAASDPDDPAAISSMGLSLSGVSSVRPKAQSKTPWVLLVMLLLLAGAGAAAAFYLWPKGPPTGPGTIALTSEPPGAAIYVDGSRRPERTPATLVDLPLGSYEIRLTAEGFAPYAATLELTRDEPGGTIDATLERPTASSYGVVRLTTTPPGATVLVDGRAVEGQTPLTVPELEPGVAHRLAITLDGYQTVTEEVLLEAGDVEEMRLTLERTPLGDDETWLVVRPTPEDATVTIDGETYDGGGPYEIRLPAETTTVRVSRSGYESAEREIELRGGREMELPVELERDRRRGRRRVTPMDDTPAPAGGPGKLTFDARPWCNVSVDGRRLGQTPIVNHTLPSGSHRITCANPELGVSRNLTVDIEPGETTRRRLDLQ